MLKKIKALSILVAVLVLSQALFAATFTVTKTDDSDDGTCDADCSLREAIAAANASADDDIIAFDGTVFGSMQTVSLTLGEIIITNNGSLTFNGTGADMLTIDGNMIGRIFTISESAVVTINDATFTNGTGVGAANTGRGGAIYNRGGITVVNNVVITGNTSNFGGAAMNNANSGNLTINNSVLSGNTSQSSGGALQNFSSGTLTVNGCTIMNNTSNSGTGGGGAQLNGTATITNSTFTGNMASSNGDGGAISSNGSSLIITNSTFSGNMADDNGGGIIRRTTNVNLIIRNSIVSGNTSGDGTTPDVATNASLTSEGNNIIGEDGTSMGWVASDMLDTDPMLLPLADNGGFGMTFLPISGSPAIDGGQDCVLDSSCATNNPPFNVTTDQRGFPRPAGSAVDVGAVEAGPSNATVSGRVTTASGRGINRVYLTISQEMLGITTVVATARTNQFGYFSFSDVPQGDNYTINAFAKGLSFDPVLLSVNGDVTGLMISPSMNGANKSSRK